METKMKERTEKDLKRLKDIDKQIWDLHDEERKIKQECSCLDYIPKVEETFAWEVTPLAICPVCGKRNGELTLEEKTEALKKFLDYGEEDCFYTEEQMKEFAERGGMNFPRYDFYQKDGGDAPIKEN